MAKHMTPEDIRSTFETWCANNTRYTWLPSTSDVEHTTSFFGGLPRQSSSSEWPVCGDCQHPMQFFMQLDMATLPDDVPTGLRSGLLQLFHCTANEGACETWQPFSAASALRIATEPVDITAPKGLSTLKKQSIVSWQQATETPHPEDHELLGLTYDYDFTHRRVTVRCAEPERVIEDLDLDLDVAEILSNTHTGEKIGGWPYWVQGSEYPYCPTCESKMDMLVQLDSEINLDFMFGDSGVGHITQCPKHPDVLAFGWACC